MSKKRDKNRIRRCIYYLDGMHCTSCEILVEKRLLKNSNIESVDASIKDGKVIVYYKGEQEIDETSLNKQFEDVGYRFSTKKIYKEADKPLVRFTNSGIEINAAKTKRGVTAIIILIIFLTAFFLLEKSELARYVSVDANSSLPAFALLGIVAGTSSCAALVGGVLLSMTKQWNEIYIDSNSQLQKARPHTMFHLGRLLSFTAFGGLLGIIGSSISLDNPTIYAFLIIAVSMMMLILALQMLGVEWAMKFQPKTPKTLTRFASNENNFKGEFMPFMTGIATFFLPCGFTLIAQSLALTSGSFFKGALMMLAFSLGTFPILLGISLTGVGLNAKPHLTARFNQAAGLIIVFFVLYNVNSQLNILGVKSLSDIRFAKTETSSNDGLAESVDGIQKLTITAKGFSYKPTSSTTLKAGAPTVLEIDNQGIEGCGQYLSARGLVDNYIYLKPGINTVEFIPEKGTYKITCSMGMVPPVTIKVL